MSKFILNDNYDPNVRRFILNYKFCFAHVTILTTATPRKMELPHPRKANQNLFGKVTYIQSMGSRNKDHGFDTIRQNSDDTLASVFDHVVINYYL